MSILKNLSIDHPYYASDSNFYSNEASTRWETMTEFLDEFECCDIDMNLIYRWDFHNRSDDEDGSKVGRYYAEIFIIKQRKGIYAPQHINHVNEKEAERFVKFAAKHWQRLQEMWKPINEEG